MNYEQLENNINIILDDIRWDLLSSENVGYELHKKIKQCFNDVGLLKKDIDSPTGIIEEETYLNNVNLFFNDIIDEVNSGYNIYYPQFSQEIDISIWISITGMLMSAVPTFEFLYKKVKANIEPVLIERQEKENCKHWLEIYSIKSNVIIAELELVNDFLENYSPKIQDEEVILKLITDGKYSRTQLETFRLFKQDIDTKRYKITGIDIRINQANQDM